MNARTSAPIDMSGYWVSVVTEDWRYRMVTPPKGNYLGIPLTGEGRRAADAWDPAKDEAAGAQCKGFGAGGIMRVPGRFHITWPNDTTMQIEADSGMQTRSFHFGGTPPADTEASWQGYSVAEWENATTARGAARTGDLKVVTTHMLPGYVRRTWRPVRSQRGVDRILRSCERSKRRRVAGGADRGQKDPQYFSMPFRNHDSLQEDGPDATGWDPQPCSAR